MSKKLGALLTILMLSLGTLAGCTTPYTPRGVDYHQWDGMNEAERQAFISDLRKRTRQIKILDSHPPPDRCRLVGMVHAVGENLAEARMRALDWAALLNATHVLWDKTDLSADIAQQVNESGGHFFAMGSAYQCPSGSDQSACNASNSGGDLHYSLTYSNFQASLPLATPL